MVMNDFMSYDILTHCRHHSSTAPSALLSSEHILSEVPFPEVCECGPQSQLHSPLYADGGP